MAITDKVAREKIVRARTNLLVSNGFFGSLAMNLRLVECTQDKIAGHTIDTMAVDGKSMYYNTEFTHGLSERETEGVVVHEVMHCCFQHFSRRGNRDPMVWNMAGDFSINLDITKAGFNLPGKPITWADLKAKQQQAIKDMAAGKPKPKPTKDDKFFLCDPKFAGHTTEQIYDIIWEEAPKMFVIVGGECPLDPGGLGGVLDSPGDGAEKDQAKQDWETNVRMAVETAKANNAGNIPGSLAKLVENLKKPKVSWRDRTRRFIDMSMIKGVSWSRLNRRSWGAGVLMPGYIADRLHHLVMINDISGSTSYAMQQEMVGEIAGALDEGTADRITVLYADTQVQHVDEFVQGDIVTCGRYTGGGTDFRDSFRWVKENAPDASCVIYLTDLQVNQFGEEPNCPVLWAVYTPDGTYEHVAERVPFGEPIHVSSTYY